MAEKVGRQVAALSAVPAGGEDVTRVRNAVDRAVALADQPSRGATGLGHDLGAATARVVSRGQWIAANLESMRYLTDPHAGRLLERSTFPAGLSRKAVAIQIGSIFGYLSTRVLGQYEVFLPGVQTQGRLTLVGPNLLEVERDLAKDSDIDAEELILGIVLHELGHRLQFEAVPWLRPHLRGIIDEYLSGTQLDPDKVKAGLSAIMSKVVSGDLGIKDVMEALLTPEQAAKLEDAQAVMSLLEGHGNVVMDWGAELMGSEGVDPARVRVALNSRRNKSGGAGKLVGKALGMGLKAAQYAMGEEFIAEVAERHGREAFNRVWESPDHIPTMDELTDPDAWAERVAAAA